MSNSESDSGSSSSGSASPRRASPQPQNGQEGDKIDAAQNKDNQEADNNPNVNDAASDTRFSTPSPPDPDERFLYLEWEDREYLPIDDGDQEDPFASYETRLIDFIVVPGVYANSMLGIGASPGSGSSEWVYKFAGKRPETDINLKNPKDSCRVFWLRYESTELFSGNQSRHAIHQTALRLLKGLRAKRCNETKKRLIYFISHDIGGTVVKDALVTASLDRESWGDISEMTRVLIFNSCPHRNTNEGDLENRLTSFLYENWILDYGKPRPSTSAISGLSKAVSQVNGLFIDSKVPLRSWIINLHSHGQQNPWDNDNFNSYSGTLGLPLEKRFFAPNDWDYFLLTEHLTQLEWDVREPNEAIVEPVQYQHERKLLALASPVYPLRDRAEINPLADLPDFQAWLDSPFPQILYIHGSHRAREVAERVFYALEDETTKLKRRAMVLYFSFDQWDVRCDSIRDMIATFLAQICNHHPKLGPAIARLLTQLHNERGWTEKDLIQFFEMFRTSDEVEQTMIVINHFDECTKGSRKSFLDNIFYRYRNDETPWKIVVTSHEPGTLTEELSGPFCVPVDLSTADVRMFPENIIGEDFEYLSRSRPDLNFRENQIREELKFVEPLESPVRQIICEQAMVRQEWPDETSFKEMFSTLDLTQSEGREDEILKSILDWALKRFPDQTILRRLFSWLLYAVRPLTIWELATVLSIGTNNDRGNICPGSSTTESLMSKIQKGFAGIVEVNHNEVRFKHPRLHHIMVASDTNEAAEEKQYLWDEIRETAHADITNLCLDYLTRDSVQEYVGKTFQVKDSETFETPTFPDRTNLASYAIQAWTHHYSLSSPRPELSDLTSKTDLIQTLARAHWSLANPATKRPPYFETLFPIFASLGLPDAVKPLNDADVFRGLLEAVCKEHKKVVEDLLEGHEFTESQLWKALEAGGSSGDEDMMLSLLDKIESKGNIPKDFDWPPVIIYRAAFLGLDRFVERILSLGCPPEPDVEWRNIAMRASPLFQATRHGHAKTVRVLLKHGASMEYTGLYERNPLHLAAVQGHHEVIKVILEESKVDIDHPSETKFTALYLAAVFGHPKAVELLLEKGADPNMGISSTSTDDDQWTPLVVAADDGFKQCVKLLLDKGANPNINGPVGPPLRWAVNRGHVDVFNMLLDAGADPRSELLKTPLLAEAVGWGQGDAGPAMLDCLLELDLDINAKDVDGNTALLAAAQSYPRDYINDVCIYKPSPQKDIAIQKLLDRGADPNLKNELGLTALLYSTSHHQYNVAKMLLAAGADPNEPSKDGISPLFDGMNVPGMARLLLEKGANPDFRTSGGWTNLTAAAHFGYIEAVEALLDHGAQVDLEYGVGVEEPENEGYRGWTPLMCAASSGYSEILRLLAEVGANLEHRGARFDQPVLHVAIFDETLPTILEFPSRIDVNIIDNMKWAAVHFPGMRFENLRRLVNAGADIELQNDRGDTALGAVSGHDLQKVQFLVKRGANINHKSPWYGSPLHQACRTPDFDIIKFLIEKGADINSTCNSGYGTPLQSLCMKRTILSSLEHEEMVEYLLSGHEKQRPDVTAKAGTLGYAINAAALCGTPAIINLILEQEGGTVNVRDDMGRMPLHFAAISGIPNFEAILQKGGDIYAKDNTGRTALHWAAQVGRLQVVEKIISLMDDKTAVDAPDIDGWTPLCWAARGIGSWLDQSHASEPSSDVPTIKLLLENGADRNVVVALGDEKWTPLKIARYCRTNSDVVSLITHGIRPEVEEGQGASEGPPSTNTKQETKGKEEPRMKLGILYDARYCDVCQCEVYGLVWTCKTCPWFDVCFKCYPHAALIHTPGHEYEQGGEEEYEGGGEEISAAVSSSSSDSDSDSDSGSEESDR